MIAVIKTVAADGWHKVRLASFLRDGGCVAPQFRIFGAARATDECKDKNGRAIRYDERFSLEWDHVREDIGGRRIDDEAHGITVCPWHHRGSRWRSDSKVHREAIRDWLARHYPEVWRAA